MSTLKVGDRVEKYEVEAFLGEGGLARVYRVRHEQLGTSYALKLLAFRGERLSNRLLREGRIQAGLRHPNVVTVIDVMMHDGRAALLMEFVEGESLEQALNKRGAMALDDALALFSQILAGVSAAHGAGVLHRDLKPGNILLQPGPEGMVAKVTDFGIARLLSTEASEGDTLQTDVIGTPGYMAPEQASDPTSVDVRADIFSLGALLYGMVTGYPPFRPGKLAQVLVDVEQGRFTPVQQRAPACPDAVAVAIERCLAPDPDARFVTCTALAAALYGADSGEVATLNRGIRSPILPPVSTPRLPTAESLAAGSMPAVAKTAVPTDTASGAPVAPTLAPTLDQRPPRSKLPVALGVALLVLLGAGAGMLATRPAQDELPGPVLVESAESGSVAAVPLAPALPPAEALPAEVPDPAPDAAAAPAPAPAAQGVAAVGEPDQQAPARTVIDAPQPDPIPLLPGDDPAEPSEALPGDPPPEPDDGVAMAELTEQPAPEPIQAAPPPPEAPAAAPPDLRGTWQGRLGGRPSTLRLLVQRGAQVEGELEVLMGTAYRTFAMSGRLEGDRLQLQGDDPEGWRLDARLSGDSLDGSLSSAGRGKGTAWKGTRQ